MKAVKQNKVYTVDKKSMDSYAAKGFDIYDEDGKIVKHGAGKTVPYGEYDAAIAKGKAMESELAAKDAEIESLKEQLAAKAAKATKAAKNKDGE